jgi:hypothetical protein
LLFGPVVVLAEDFEWGHGSNAQWPRSAASRFAHRQVGRIGILTLADQKSNQHSKCKKCTEVMGESSRRRSSGWHQSFCSVVGFDQSANDDYCVLLSNVPCWA